VEFEAYFEDIYWVSRG